MFCQLSSEQSSVEVQILLLLYSLSLDIFSAMAKISVFIGFFVGFLLLGLVSASYFEQLYQPSWAFDHFTQEGDTLKLKLDNYSGK